MNKLTPIALAATLATFTVFPAVVHAATGEQATITSGKALYSAEGKRLGSVYRVLKDGTVQIIIDGRLLAIKPDTISNQNGKLVTSLTKSAVLAAG